jgi:hypothetical protein
VTEGSGEILKMFARPCRFREFYPGTPMRAVFTCWG